MSECDDHLAGEFGGPDHWCTRPLGHAGWHQDGDGVKWRGREPQSPGPAPDRAAAELAEAEEWLRANVSSLNYSRTSRSVHMLLAELDRQRALIAALLAECERRKRNVEAYEGHSFNAAMTCDEIRALLGGEGR